MPYASKKQQAWAHTPSGTKALGGAAKVHEWDEATKRKPGGFGGLPKRVPKRAGDPPGADLTMTSGRAPMEGIGAAPPATPDMPLGAGRAKISPMNAATAQRTSGNFGSKQMPRMRPVSPVHMATLRMAKPKGVKGIAPQSPSGTRGMMGRKGDLGNRNTGGVQKPFGSMAPALPNAFDGY